MPTYEELRQRCRVLSEEMAVIAHEVSDQLAEASRFRPPSEAAEHAKLWDEKMAAYPRYAEAGDELGSLQKELHDLLRVGDTPRAVFFRLKDRVFNYLSDEAKANLRKTACHSAMDLWTPLNTNMHTLQEEPENLLAFKLCVDQLRALHKFHYDLGELTEPFPEV